MDINFQDRIDEYLLHPDRLSEEEKSQFLSELEADPQKRAQFELTRDASGGCGCRVLLQP